MVIKVFQSIISSCLYRTRTFIAGPWDASGCAAWCWAPRVAEGAAVGDAILLPRKGFGISDAVTCGRALFRSAVKFCVGLLKPKPCGGFSMASWRVGGGVALTFCLPFEEKNEEKIVA